MGVEIQRELALEFVRVTEAAALSSGRLMGTGDRDAVRGDDVIYAATGVTDGELLRGVRYSGSVARTHSLVMRGTTGTVRFIEAIHRLDKKAKGTQPAHGGNVFGHT